MSVEPALTTGQFKTSQSGYFAISGGADRQLDSRPVPVQGLFNFSQYFASQGMTSVVFENFAWLKL